MPHPPTPADPTPEHGAGQSPRLLWDWPTRIFHWVLAGSFTAAFLLANLVSKQSKVFYLHVVFGSILVAAILLRVIWGFVGSQPSRFRSFLFSPKALLHYLRGAMQGKDQPSSGHNPGSSYAIYAMLLIPLALAATGWANWSGLLDVGDLHEGLAALMVIVIGLHVAGLGWHTLRHRENIAMSMLHGKRRIPREHAIDSSRPWVGVAFLVLLGMGTMMIISSGLFY